MSIHVFGIRHHGPGSARSLLKAFQALQPDLILVEGPPDADGILPMALHPAMQPPVALLVYAPEHLQRAAYYPFAVFSPEWQAIRYGLQHGVVVRFMDLPQAHRMALMAQLEAQRAREAAKAEVMAESAAPSDALTSELQAEPEIQHDPLYWLAKAAGFNDGERWWEQMVEQRRDDTGLFEAILAAMSALREVVTEEIDPLNPFREAYMRRIIRAARREGYRRIAVVCGAWHAPVLAKMPPATEDTALLKHLPKLEVKAAWVPWTHGRLARGVGYGAGINAPGWYHHLWSAWTTDQSDLCDLSTGWMTRTARLLRKYDLEASPAQIIDAVRLAETLASMRGRSAPGLAEFNDAALAALCFGNTAPLRLIYSELVTDDRLGKVPDDAPAVPLQRDLAQWLERLELKPEPLPTTLELDLRQPRDLERSQLLHRLALLNIHWGALVPNARSGLPGPRPASPASGSLLSRIAPPPPPGAPTTPPPPDANAEPPKDRSGTAYEVWRLQWQPEFAITLIEASIWGNTISEAAVALTRAVAEKAADLPTLTQLLDRALLANLLDLIDPLLRLLHERGALTGDLPHLMDTLPPLARISRYSNVRQTDGSSVRRVVDGLSARICIGLPNACARLADNAAGEMLIRLINTDRAISTLHRAELTEAWQGALWQVVVHRDSHGLLAGRACRLLFDAGAASREQLITHTNLALSDEPMRAAQWIEGLLKGSGMALLYDDVLWQTLDAWLAALPEPAFMGSLPILRRTFSAFTLPERRQIGERARRGPGRIMRRPEDEAVDLQRANAALRVVAQMLGVVYEQ